MSHPFRAIQTFGLVCLGAPCAVHAVDAPWNRLSAEARASILAKVRSALDRECWSPSWLSAPLDGSAELNVRCGCMQIISGQGRDAHGSRSLDGRRFGF